MSHNYSCLMFNINKVNCVNSERNYLQVLKHVQVFIHQYTDVSRSKQGGRNKSNQVSYFIQTQIIRVLHSKETAKV